MQKKQFDCIIDQDVESKSSLMTITDEGKDRNKVQSQKESQKQYNYVKSYILSFLCCLCFGTANYVQGSLSAISGEKGIWVEFPSLVIIWIVYKIIMYIQFKKKNPDSSYFKLENSSYYVTIKNEQKELQLEIRQISWKRISFPFIRAFLNTISVLAINICFKYTEISGINTGIISSVFATSCVFVVITFYFLENQKLTIYDFIGIFFVICCVVLVSIGGKLNQESSQDSKDSSLFYVFLAVGLAITCGALFAFSTFSLQQIIKSGLDPDQAQYDSCLIQGIIFFFIYLYVDHYNPGVFKPMTWFYANVYTIMVTFGIINCSKALQHGKGGTVQAISETKTVFHTLLNILLDHLIPNFVQVSGLVSGFIGVAFIVLQKKKQQ